MPKGANTFCYCVKANVIITGGKKRVNATEGFSALQTVLSLNVTARNTPAWNLKLCTNQTCLVLSLRILELTAHLEKLSSTQQCEK